MVPAIAVAAQPKVLLFAAVSKLIFVVLRSYHPSQQKTKKPNPKKKEMKKKLQKFISMRFLKKLLNMKSIVVFIDVHDELLQCQAVLFLLLAIF